MALGRLHVIVGIADNVVLAEIGGEFRAIGILTSAIPDRLSSRRHDDALVDVEGPAVITRQPVHVRRIAADQHVDAPGLHGTAGLLEACFVLCQRELQICLCPASFLNYRASTAGLPVSTLDSTNR